jgi:hypothetical protein
MGNDRELKLNSIDRYTKSSRNSNFVLEEHGHCEVPAGCGGVVLRWRNPNAPLPVKLQLWLNVEPHKVAIDKNQPSSSRPLIQPGRHVLTISVQPDRQQSVQLLFSASIDQDPAVTLVTSQASPDWRWTDSEPDWEAWLNPEFDTGSLNTVTGAALADEVITDYAVRKLLNAGATAITTPPGADEIYIRTTFDVPQGR